MSNEDVDTQEQGNENEEIEAMGWQVKTSDSGTTSYFNPYTGDSQDETPHGPPSKPDKVHCKHILVKHAGSRRPTSWREKTITRSKEEAHEILAGYRAQIDSGDKTFDEICKEFSDCSSAKQGGDLGLFGKGQMHKSFEEAAFNLKIEEMSDLIDTDSGVHLIFRVK